MPSAVVDSGAADRRNLTPCSACPNSLALLANVRALLLVAAGQMSESSIGTMVSTGTLPDTEREREVGS